MAKEKKGGCALTQFSSLETHLKGAELVCDLEKSPNPDHAADARSQRFVSNFVGQWLQTRDVANLNLDVFRVLGNKKERNSTNPAPL